MDMRESFLIVGRLVPYKKVDLAIKVFNKLNLPLVVVGSGSELKKLKKIAGPNIAFAGTVGDERLIEYYRHAKALIFPQEEDFGLVPIEAQASGTPVIAYGKGGALETVVSGKTGLFFGEQTISSLTEAVEKFERTNFDPHKCIENAAKFDFAHFSKSFSEELIKHLPH